MRPEDLERWEPGGWEATVEERSPSVFRIEARNAEGFTIGFTTTDPDGELEKLRAGGAYREPWLTTDEIAEHFRAGRRWVERMVNLGMPYVRIAKRRKFKASACEEWLRWTGVIDDERL